MPHVNLIVHDPLKRNFFFSKAQDWETLPQVGELISLERTLWLKVKAVQQAKFFIFKLPMWRIEFVVPNLESVEEHFEGVEGWTRHTR
tara:strand:- start:5321 stop:5584 length:264 start_codon:yes stop_codon:yes gene_type:complete